MQLLLVSRGFFVVAVLLFLHHGWKHAHEDPATSLARQESYPAVCYFQLSDIFNFRTSNHETWIILCLCVSWSCWSRWFVPWVRVHSDSEVFSMMVNVFCLFMMSALCMLYMCMTF
jgi:hypothetical protein